MSDQDMFAYAMLAWCVLMAGTLLTVALHLVVSAPLCDSVRLPKGEDSRSEAECAASQSGGATSAASPDLKPPNHPSNREAT